MDFGIHKNKLLPNWRRIKKLNFCFSPRIAPNNFKSYVEPVPKIKNKFMITLVYEFD